MESVHLDVISTRPAADARVSDVLRRVQSRARRFRSIYRCGQSRRNGWVRGASSVGSRVPCGDRAIAVEARSAFVGGPQHRSRDALRWSSNALGHAVLLRSGLCELSRASPAPLHRRLLSVSRIGNRPRRVHAQSGAALANHCVRTGGDCRRRPDRCRPAVRNRRFGCADLLQHPLYLRWAIGLPLATCALGAAILAQGRSWSRKRSRYGRCRDSLLRSHSRRHARGPLHAARVPLRDAVSVRNYGRSDRRWRR